MAGRPKPRPALSWRDAFEAWDDDKRADFEERAAIVAEGCKVSQEVASQMAFERMTRGPVQQALTWRDRVKR